VLRPPEQFYFRRTNKADAYTMITSAIRTLFTFLIILQVLIPGSSLAQNQSPGKEASVSAFRPTWESLQQYKVPEWFRNAKFGIWAHWGPQCQPEQGDWYGRFMYDEGNEQYKWHVANYGHPSKFGFKDVINDWKAEKWDPSRLVALYKKTGAQYFFAMANHHDNLDLWNSKHHEWNSVRVGPRKDIVAGWAKAAKENNLPFGLSVHASHAWTWFETSQRADTAGPLRGVPYDGKLRKEDGKGTWWEGLDPQELYAQNHELSQGSENIYSLWRQWDWQNGASQPTQEYCNKFYSRVMDLIGQYNPDLLYFDDTVLPFYPVNDVGLKIAAEYYNQNMATHNGKLEAVLFGKVLNDEQKKCMVWDVERGAPDKLQPLAWQTCTCIGDWHYKRSVYENNGYKSAQTVIHMLVDIVSKNGNLLLNIPVRGDGSIDEKEVAILEGISKWMDVNKESIFDTRPWIVFGEGPSAEQANPVNAQGFNEGKTKYNARDIRFNQKGKILYATTLGVPDSATVIKALGKDKKNGTIKTIEVLGSKEKIIWKQTAESLVIEKPKMIPNDIAVVFTITLK
jgi:alpha-L-fucosidase